MTVKLEKYDGFVWVVNTLTPKFLRNVYYMIKFRCIIHPEADIINIKNLVIGSGSYIGKSTIISRNGGVTIGQNCLINNNCEINSKQGVVCIDDDTTINYGCYIDGNGGVYIGRGCRIAPYVTIVKNHKINRPGQDYLPVSRKSTWILDRCWICTNTVIIDGCVILDDVVVGANSFVNKNLAKNGIYAGSPVRLIKKRK